MAIGLWDTLIKKKKKKVRKI
jgi:hypothetical protein